MHGYLSLERKAMQAHVFAVHNLHATLIERGKNASLIQRRVPKAENELGVLVSISVSKQKQNLKETQL
jgi:hypothetical protein